MGWVKDYLLSVVAVALLCGIITGLAGRKGSAAAVIKLICGLFLVFTVIKPVIQVRISDFSRFTEDLSSTAEIAVSNGEKMAEEAMKEIIKTETQSYILDKAAALGVTLQVEVILSENLPSKVVLKGNVSPYAKAQLTSQITQELGIPREEQQWIS